MPRKSILPNINNGAAAMTEYEIKLMSVLSKYYKSLKYKIEIVQCYPINKDNKTISYGSSYNYYKISTTDEKDQKLKSYELINEVNEQLNLLDMKSLIGRTILKYITIRDPYIYECPELYNRDECSPEDEKECAELANSIFNTLKIQKIKRDRKTRTDKGTRHKKPLNITPVERVL